VPAPAVTCQLHLARLTTGNPATGNRITGILLRDGRRVSAEAVIVTTGTFLNGLIHCGEQQYPPDARENPPPFCSAKRSRTSPARMPPQNRHASTPRRPYHRTGRASSASPAMSDPRPLVFRTRRVAHHDSQVPCYIAFTHRETHRIIRENVHRSPMYSGQIQSTGPRYCPSIEDKIVSSPTNLRISCFWSPRASTPTKLRQRHEHLAANRRATRDSQVHPRTRKRRDDASGYAIEYDSIDPTELKRTLERKKSSACSSADRLMARQATKKRRARDSWRHSTPR